MKSTGPHLPAAGPEMRIISASAKRCSRARIASPTPKTFRPSVDHSLQFGTDKATPEGFRSWGTVGLGLSANPGGAFIQW